MFRTEVEVSNANINLSLQDKVVTIGSCFAEVIGNKLTLNKIDALTNPFGTIFNPLSVSLLLKASVGTPYNFEQQLVHHNGIWYGYDFHSSISSPSKEELLAELQNRLQATFNHLKEASLLVITLGTAVAYRLTASGSVVANCHKLPASNFNRELLNQEEVLSAFRETIGLLKATNPKLKILLTVSPVRHIKETILMNSVSKSILRVICHQLQEDYTDVLYFPAFEIMMDDLRDYRYYKDDMLHPTTMAEDYIWQKFVKAYYDEPFQGFITEWTKVMKALHHKPFHPQAPSHQQFIQNTITKLEQLAQKYRLHVDDEIAQLKQQQV